MKVAEIYVSNNTAQVKKLNDVTRGMVGATVLFTFSREWDGLSKTAVFRNNREARDQVNISSNQPVEIPWELIADANGELMAGVCGFDETGNVVIPTTWAVIGRINPGAIPSDAPAAPPTPDWTQQIQAQTNEALKEATKAKPYATQARLAAEKAAVSVNASNENAQNARLAAAMAAEYADGAQIAAQTCSKSTEMVKQDMHIAEESAREAAAGAAAAKAAAAQAAKVVNGKADRIYVDNYFASSVSEKLSGEIVSTGMVAPVAHELICRVSSKNILPYPYVETTKTENNVTFADHGDGTISVSGTAAGYAGFCFVKKFPVEMGRTVTLSGMGANSRNLVFYILASYEDGTTANYYAGKTISMDTGKYSNKIYLEVGIKRDNNAVTMAEIAPILEYSAKPTMYTPYVPDLKHTTVSVQGNNLVEPFSERDVFSAHNATYKIVAGGNGIRVTPTDSQSQGHILRQSQKIHVRKGITYAVSSRTVKTNAGMSVKICVLNGDRVVSEDAVFTAADNCDVSLGFYVGNGGKGDYAEFLNIMLEASEEKNSWSSYVQPRIFHPEEDGTVLHMQSVSPGMSIMTDTPGVLIEAGYIVDTKKYIDKKFEQLNNAILAIGGNI